MEPGIYANKSSMAGSPESQAYYDDLSQRASGVASASSAQTISDLLNSDKDPLDILKELASQDESYVGQYLETLLSRQDTGSARSFSEYMDSSKYQRAVADLKAAGLNPWLAVQSGLGLSGSQEYSAARTSSSNAYALKSSRKSADASERNSQRQIAATIISAVASAAMIALMML